MDTENLTSQNYAQGLPTHNGRFRSGWNIRQVREREAHYSKKPLDPVCPACCGLGVVKDETPVRTEHGYYPYGTLVKCPVCGNEQRRSWLAKNCGLKGRMLDARLKDWRDTAFRDRERNQQRIDARKLMQDAIEQRHGFYTFYGDFGAGKSYAMAIVCNELRDQLIETHYATLPHVLNHLRSLIGTNQEGSSYFDRLLSVPVLALDEVTRFKATEWAMEQVFVLANRRYELRDSHLTLFVTNDDPTTPMPVDQSIGYLMSRMREGKILKLEGDVRPAVSGG